MSSTAVKSLGVIASAVFMFGWSDSAVAAKANPEAAVVAQLYKDFAWQAMATQTELFGEDIAHLDKSSLQKYFAPELADLLAKDAACQVKYQGICNLDFDLLFDSQDPRVTDLEIAAAAPGKVLVVFKDPVSDEKTQIDFHVRRVAGAWKITDIVYRKPDTLSLKKLLSRKIP